MADFRNERIPSVSSSLRDLLEMGRAANDPGRRRPSEIAPATATLADLKNMGVAMKAPMVDKFVPGYQPGWTAEDYWKSRGVPIPQDPAVSGQAQSSVAAEAMLDRGPAPAGTRKADALPMLYQNASGSAPASPGATFMDRSGAFTGPNNDPTTPGMTREWREEPILEAFNPDDSRFAKRQIDIEQQDKKIAMKEQRRLAAQIAEDRARTIANETIDRQRAQEEQDRRMAWMADEQKRAQEAHEARQAWTAANQGLSATPENQKAVFEAQQRNQNIEEFRGNWTDLAQKESQVPLIFQAISEGEDISQVAPDVANFISQYAPDLDKLPPEQKVVVLAEIQKDLLAQIKTQKFTAQKALEQRNRQNFGRQSATDELTGFGG